MSNAHLLWPYPRVVVHRGGGFHAPENTLEAFIEAERLGCSAVEFDVQTTADGALVLCHDEYLGRVVQGKGRVCEMTAEQLRGLSVINPERPEQKPARVAFFDEAVQLCSRLGLMMNVELKPASGHETVLAEAAAAAFDSFAVNVPVLVSSFSAECLAEFHRLQPKLPCGFLYETEDVDWKTIAREIKVQTVHPEKRFAVPEMIAAAHAMGLGVLAWTTDAVDEAQKLMQNGADALCTNRPEILTFLH